MVIRKTLICEDESIKVGDKMLSPGFLLFFTDKRMLARYAEFAVSVRCDVGQILLRTMVTKIFLVHHEYELVNILYNNF